MALNINELKDIRTGIEWLIKNTRLVENNRTNIETIYNITTNSIVSLDRAIGELSHENSGLHKHGVNACFSDDLQSCIDAERENRVKRIETFVPAFEENTICHFFWIKNSKYTIPK